MPAYSVTLLSKGGQTLPSGANGMLVFAASSAAAIAMAKARHTGDSNAAWADATATEIAVGADMTGFRLRVVIPPAGEAAEIEEVITGGAGNDLDDMATNMATALNLNDAIANAAYNDSLNILTVAGAGDSLGDRILMVEFLAPESMEGADAAPIPGFVGTITDEGASSVALSVALGADSVAIPAFYARFKTV